MQSCCYHSVVKAVHFFLWCYGVNFVNVISHICTPKTKEELSNNQNCQKSIPKPYYKRKQRHRIITSLKGSIRHAGLKTFQMIIFVVKIITVRIKNVL